MSFAARSLSAPPAPGETFANVVASLSPHLWYRFSETSGTVAADSSGNGHHGRYTGDVTFGAPSLIPSEAANLAVELGANGGVGYAFAPEESFLTTGKTFLAVCKTRSLASNQAIFHRGNYFASGQQGMALRCDAGGQLGIEFVSAGWWGAKFHAPIAVNTVYLVVLRIDNDSQVTMFLNGAKQTQTLPAPLVVGGALPIQIGRIFAGDQSPWRGVMDDFVVFDSLLSDADVARLSSV